MKAFFRSFFASLLAIVVVIAVVVAVIAAKSSQKSKIKDHSYLVVDIYGEIPEYNPPAGIMGEILGGKPETLQRILGNLEKAAGDEMPREVTRWPARGRISSCGRRCQNPVAGTRRGDPSCQ